MEVFVQHLKLRLHRVPGKVGAMLLAGAVAALGLSLLALQVIPTLGAQAQTAQLNYQQGRYINNGWLCYGWNGGTFRCTQHWHSAINGALVSDNPSWVPNYASSTPAQAVGVPALTYKPGYYVDDGWLCYGWSSGAYRCTQHWQRGANGALISDNPSWVPNGLPASGTGSSASTTTAVSPAPAPRRPAPAPRPVAPAAAPAPSGSIATQIRAVFGVYGNQAVAVATCESGLNPNAINSSSGASGLFQFLPSTWRTTSYAGYSPFNAWANIQAAHQVFQRDGNSWREWVCQP